MAWRAGIAAAGTVAVGSQSVAAAGAAAVLAAAAPDPRMPWPVQPWRCSGPRPRIYLCRRPTCRPRRRRAGVRRSRSSCARLRPPTWRFDGDGNHAACGQLDSSWGSSRARALRAYAPVCVGGVGRVHFGQREGSAWVTVRRGARYRVGGRRGKMCVGWRGSRWIFAFDSRRPYVNHPRSRPGSSTTDIGSGRRVYAPARRISRASGAGTCWSRGRRLTFKLGSAWDEKAPRGCFLCRSATRWARVEACGYASSGRFGRPNEQIREVVERHGPSSRPRGLRRALRLGTEMGYRKQRSFLPK